MHGNELYFAASRLVALVVITAWMLGCDGLYTDLDEIDYLDAGEDADCVPLSGDELCEQQGHDCGEVQMTDNCGEPRVVDCGQFEQRGCGEDGVCLKADDVDGLEANGCACPFDGLEELFGEDDAAICEEVDRQCGSFEPFDVCGLAWDGFDTVDCGFDECPEDECGVIGDNECGCHCEIDDVCLADGDADADNPCMICDSEQDEHAYVPVEDGVSCGENRVCEAEEEETASACVCAEGYQDCDGDCVDVRSNAQHCGQCGNACEDDDFCVDGSCEAECPEELDECDGQCVDTDSDADHCGGCGEGCDEVEGGQAQCDGGECSYSCDSDDHDPCELSAASDGSEGADTKRVCVDTDASIDHCGECNNECELVEGGESECIGGSCEQSCAIADQTPCQLSVQPRYECVDIGSDIDHCSECGDACDEGEICEPEGVGIGECDECSPGDDGDAPPDDQCQQYYDDRIYCDRELGCVECLNDTNCDEDSGFVGGCEDGVCQ